MSTVPMKNVRRPFLTARWSNLAILTWEVPPALLEPHLPAGLELDRRDGAAFASLVALLARALYHVSYLVAPIESGVGAEPGEVVTARRLRWRGRAQSIEVAGG